MHQPSNHHGTVQLIRYDQLNGITTDTVESATFEDLAEAKQQIASQMTTLDKEAANLP